MRHRWFRVRDGRLLPDDDDTYEWVHRLREGQAIEMEPHSQRSVPWHRFYFGLCRTIGQNQHPVRDVDSIDAELRVLAGHFNVLKLHNHPIEVRWPKRIAFDKLTADEWAKLWPSLELAIRERFGEGYIEQSPS